MVLMVVESARGGRWDYGCMPELPFGIRWRSGGGELRKHRSERQKDRDKLIFKGWARQTDWLEECRANDY